MIIPKKIELVDAEESEKASAVACIRIERMPVPAVPADPENCSECGARIWVAKMSPKKPPRICIECITSIVESKMRDGEEVTYEARIGGAWDI